MKKNYSLKIFNTHEEYEAFVNTEEYTEPHVSWCANGEPAEGLSYCVQYNEVAEEYALTVSFQGLTDGARNFIIVNGESCPLKCYQGNFYFIPEYDKELNGEYYNAAVASYNDTIYYIKETEKTATEITAYYYNSDYNEMDVYDYLIEAEYNANATGRAIVVNDNGEQIKTVDVPIKSIKSQSAHLKSIKLPKTIEVVNLYECYYIEDIYYEGTIAECQSVEWGVYGNVDGIHCSDGEYEFVR